MLFLSPDLSIIALFFAPLFFPGRHYLNVGNGKSEFNKLTGINPILVTLGAIITIATFWVYLTECPTGCDGWGAMIFALGLLPAMFFYGVAVILSLINKIKKRPYLN